VLSSIITTLQHQMPGGHFASDRSIHDAHSVWFRECWSCCGFEWVECVVISIVEWLQCLH